MENKLDFAFMFSLKDNAMRRLVVNLWNEPDILALIEKYRILSDVYGNYSESWRETVECKVIDKIARLPLPKTLTEEILLMVTPIGLEIKWWKGFHERYLEKSDWEEPLQKYLIPLDINASILAKLSWTSAGTIDYQKTAVELIVCKMVDVVKRYKIACLYCLEDFVPMLWEQLPEEIKKKFYNKEDILQIHFANWPYCWPYIVKGEQSKLNFIARTLYRRRLTFNTLACKISAYKGNLAAFKYFYRKLTPGEKQAILSTTDGIDGYYFFGSTFLSETFPLRNYSNVFVFLLSLQSHEDQMKLFQRKTYKVLIPLLEWPWQDIFIKIASLIWPILPAEDYSNLLFDLKTYFGKSNYYFPPLFQEFFKNSPINFRKTFVDVECQFGNFFPRIFRLQDSRTIQIIFRNIDYADRLRIVTSNPIFRLFYICISTDVCHMIEVCLREVRLSEDHRENLKKAFLLFLSENDSGCVAWSRRQKFLQLLDETNANRQSKRCFENETLNETKKICSDK